MAYDTVANIVSDAAAELGLGTVSDVYGSTDPNVIQMRTMLKSLGKDLVKSRDWTHLQKEYSFVTRQNWAASTQYEDVALTWTSSTLYTKNTMVKHFGHLYRCSTAGTSSANGEGPNSTAASITDGTCVWKYQNEGAANIVVHGLYYYTNIAAGVSGTTGPYSASNAGINVGQESDGSTTWQWTGNGADYALPSDFSNMLDQTGWNRTNRLPVGGPVDGQMWQYLKGRQQGVVFNVLFRQVAGLMRLYPDTDTPGGYDIHFEYISNSWVSATGGTTPTTNAPTANTDIIYFDRALLLSGVKLRWLKAKGFDTTHAQREYDDVLEKAKNVDGSSPVLNLRGRGPYDPLIGVQNIPITGFGS